MNYPPALFAYAVTPAVAPYATAGAGTPVTFMVTVNNPIGTHVECSELVFTIPIGRGAGDLTTDPSGLAPAPALGVPWSITSDDAGNLTALPNAGTTGLGAGDSIAFLISNVHVNDLPGLALVGVWEQTDDLRYDYLRVTKVAPGLAITSFTANPVQVSTGSPTTLSWTTTGAQTCTLSWQGNTRAGLDPDDTLQISPTETTTYTLTASSTPQGQEQEASTGESSTVSEQVSVYVPQVAILSFGASPLQVPQDGPTTLSWLVQNATQCTITPGGTSVDPIQGEQVVHPHDTGPYSLTAQGFGRSVSMPAPVSVMPATAGPFTATPSQLPPSTTQSTTLRWSTQWATSCSIDGIGEVPCTGSCQVRPAATTTYQLHPVGLDAPTPTVQVTVCPAITSLRIHPLSTQGVTVSYETVGGNVTGTLNGQPIPNLTGSNSIAVGIPVALTLTVTGLGMASTVTIDAPAQLDGTQVDDLHLTCGYSLNAPGAPATLTWNVQGGQPSGVISALETKTVSGATGTTTFDIGPGPDSDDHTWALTLHLTSDTSPTGPKVLMSGVLPSPVSSPSEQEPPAHPPNREGEPS